MRSIKRTIRLIRDAISHWILSYTSGFLLLNTIARNAMFRKCCKDLALPLYLSLLHPHILVLLLALRIAWWGLGCSSLDAIPTCRRFYLNMFPGLQRFLGTDLTACIRPIVERFFLRVLAYVLLCISQPIFLTLLIYLFGSFLLFLKGLIVLLYVRVLILRSYSLYRTFYPRLRVCWGLRLFRWQFLGSVTPIFERGVGGVSDFVRADASASVESSG